MRTICAYVGTELVGFAIVLITIMPHYSAPVATMESFFVAARRRESGAGLALRRAVERISKAHGARGLLISAAVGSRLEKLLKKSRAFQESHHIFFKALT
jgi:predicted acetyltransferase